MTRQMKRSALRVAFVAAAVGLSVWPGGLDSEAATGAARLAQAGAPAECQGDACSQVTLTQDEAGQKFTARNNSSDRWVRISASNLAAYAGVCLAPGKEGALNLKSIVGSYSASYAQPKCEAPEGS